MGNPIKRFFELIRNPSYSRTTTLLVILTIALSIPLTVFVAQKQQETRQQAASCSTADPCDGWNYESCPGGYIAVCGGSRSGCISGTKPDLSRCSDFDATCKGKGGICSSSSSCPSGLVKIGVCAYTACCAQQVSPPTPGQEKCPTGSGVPAGFKSQPCKQGDAEILKSCGPAKPGQCSVEGCFLNPVSNEYCRFDNGTCYSDSKCLGVNPTQQPACDVKTVVGTCTPKSNTCNGEGQQTVNYLTRADGTTCTERRGVIEDCTLPSKTNNCTASTPVCSNGQCIASAAPPPATVNTTFAFVLNLHGVGNFADSKGGPGNKNPRNTNRSSALKVELFNTDGTTKVSESRGNLSYDGAASGVFTAEVVFPNLPTGRYLVRVKPNGYLRENVTGLVQDTSKTAKPIDITAGQKITLGLPSILAVNGDLDGDNRLTILDHDILISCSVFGNDNRQKCDAAGASALADLNDDGTVNEFDYNLFLREISVRREGH